MREQSGAYIINRGGRKPNSNRGGKRAAGVLITVLLLLTAAICLLVVFLPRLSNKSAVTSGKVEGKTFYFLSTAEMQERAQALVQAQYAIERGGAGYIYNDGKYNIVAAVYERESDVQTLVTVNPDSYYFSLSFGSVSDGDSKTVGYLIGDWFQTVYTAATELDKGNITESAAESAVMNACNTLCKYAENTESARLRYAVLTFEYAPPQAQTVLSYIRYVNVRLLISAYNAIN